MRAVLLLTAIAAALVITLAYPFVGIILWTWFAVQQPHQEAYSISSDIPLNLIIAIVTVASWALSNERKLPPNQFLIWAVFVFLIWITFSSFFAVLPDWSWPFWDRTWKSFALGILVAILATNKVRIHAIVLTIVLSLFYYGIKGGIFTLLTAGAFRVHGPPSTMISDNNMLALALLMAVPLAYYLLHQSANRLIRAGLATGILLTLIATVGSYSRGAFLALGALAVVGVMKTRHRVRYVAITAVAGLMILAFMPASYWERMHTIKSIETDASFHGREVAWQVAYFSARDHFPFGAGFNGPQLDSVFKSYFPTEKSHAAHSIFFEVLGDTGFVGLAIYIAILGGAFWKSMVITKRCRGRPDLAWAFELASMIQVALFVFCVAGAALSMAYYDVFILCALVLVPLGEIVERECLPDLTAKFAAGGAPEAGLLGLSFGGS